MLPPCATTAQANAFGETERHSLKMRILRRHFQLVGNQHLSIDKVYPLAKMIANQSEIRATRQGRNGHYTRAASLPLLGWHQRLDDYPAAARSSTSSTKVRCRNG